MCSLSNRHTKTAPDELGAVFVLFFVLLCKGYSFSQYCVDLLRVRFHHVVESGACLFRRVS